jgi:hypothetical protein
VRRAVSLPSSSSFRPVQLLDHGSGGLQQRLLRRLSGGCPLPSHGRQLGGLGQAFLGLAELRLGLDGVPARGTRVVPVKDRPTADGARWPMSGL